MDHATIDFDDDHYPYQPDFAPMPADHGNKIFYINGEMGNWSWFMILCLVGILSYLCYTVYWSATSLFEDDPHLQTYVDHTVDVLNKRIKGKTKLDTSKPQKTM